MNGFQSGGYTFRMWTRYLSIPLNGFDLIVLYPTSFVLYVDLSIPLNGFRGNRI